MSTFKEPKVHMGYHALFTEWVKQMTKVDSEAKVQIYSTVDSLIYTINTEHSCVKYLSPGVLEFYPGTSRHTYAVTAYEWPFLVQGIPLLLVLHGRIKNPNVTQEELQIIQNQIDLVKRIANIPIEQTEVSVTDTETPKH